MAKTRITCLSNVRQGGQNSARNYGVRNSSAGYVYFLDSDDYLVADEFNKLLAYMKEHEASLYRMQLKAVDRKGNELPISTAGTKTGYPVDVYPVGHLGKHIAMRDASNLVGWVIQRDLVEKYPLMEGIYIGEDMLSLLPIIANAQSLEYTGLCPYRYVQDPHSVTGTLNVTRRMDIIKGFDTVFNDYPSLLRDYHEEMEWQAILNILFWGCQAVLQKPYGKHVHYARYLRDWMRRCFPHWQSNKWLKEEPIHNETSFKLLVGGHYFTYTVLSNLKRRIDKVI